MNWTNLIGGIYIGVAILLFFRYLSIALRIRDSWKEQDLDFKISEYVSRMIGDAVAWPVYVIWFGLKEFIKELK